MADPKIRFDILANAEGQAGIQALAKELEKLDDSLDPQLAVRARETAAQLREVGLQQEAVDVFKKLKNATIEAASGLEKAQTQAQAFAREISESGAPTRTQAGQMEKLRDAVRAAKDEHAKSLEKLNEHRKAMSEVGLSTQELAQQQTELSARQRTLRGEAADIAEAFSEQATAAADAKENARALADAEAEASKSITQHKDAIGAMLGEQKSQNTLAQKQLDLSKQEQTAALAAAKAKGDETAAIRAQQALRQVEAQQLRLTADAKRQEAAAAENLLQVRREELATAGPLTQAKQRELSAAENAARALRVEAAAADVAAGRIEQYGNEANDASGKNNKLGESAQAAGDLLKNFAGVIAAGFTFDQLVQAAAQMETLKSGLQAVTGDANLAAKEFDFVRQVATRVGADITDVGQAFLGLSAATRGTAVEGEPTRQVFEAVAAAMGKAGKSSAETQNALVALAQMASKGTVSMEELRGQLGEALPGALQAAASGLGITTQDLIKLVEQGKIAAEDLFPALTKGLNELYGSGGQGAQTLAQEITNIKNQFVELANSIGESGGLDALKTGAEIAQMGLVLLDDTLIRTGKTIGVLAAALVNLDFSGVPEAFAEIEAEGRDKLLKAAQHNQTLRSALLASGDAATQAALKQQDAAAATQKAGDAAAATGSTYVALASAYGKAGEELGKQAAAAEQSRIAREAEGKASVALAQAFGTESEKRTASAEAATQDAAQLVELARLRVQEVELLKAELIAKQAMLAANGGASEQRQKELADLQQEIEKRQSVADKALAQAQSSQLAAAAAQAEALAMQDNSARVKELAVAYEEARAKVEQLRAARADGTDVTTKLAEAEMAAGKAAAIYKDALNDQLAALEAKRLAATANLNLQQLSVKVAIEEQRSISAVARARGDVYTATNAENEIRKLEIQLVVLSADSKRAEARAMLAGVEATRAQLEASGQLTAVKRAELDASIAKARALEMEAQIGDITAQRMRDLANATSQSGNAAVGAAAGHDVLRESLGNVGGSADNTKGSVDRLSDALRRLQQLQNKPSPNPLQGGGVANPAPYGYTADGFIANKDGSAAGTFNNSVPIDKAFAVKQAAETGDYSGITLADAQAAYKQAMDAQAWIEATVRNNPAGVSFQARQDTMGMVNAARSALERLGGSTAGADAKGISSAGRTSTVVIKMGGKSTSVNTASDADADALTGMLKQLQDFGGRSS